MSADWEPVKPTLGVAQEAFQVLLELNRQHPGDLHLQNALEHARCLRDELWQEHDARRRTLL